jgi:hypothetical protein
MRFVVGLSLATLAILLPVQAAPGRMDVSKRAPRVSTEEKMILPENKPVERNEVLMDKRVTKPTYEKKEALVGERRSHIALEESREKKFFRSPEPRKYDVVERKESVWSGKEARYSTKSDAYRSKSALRFQEKIGEAMPFNENVKPVVSKRTTFDRVNRFAFRRNSGEGVGVTKAGSEEASRDISGSSSPSVKDSAPKNTPVPEGPQSLSRR